MYYAASCCAENTPQGLAKVSMDACIYACIPVRMYACIHVCMYVCAHACVHVCMYACMPRMHVLINALHACMCSCMHACHICMY